MKISNNTKICILNMGTGFEARNSMQKSARFKIYRTEIITYISHMK